MMLIQATNILNKPIIASDTEKELGRISEIIVDPENGRVTAFSVSKLLGKTQIVSEVDILDLTKEGLFINSEDALVSLSEILPVKKILDKKIKIINSKAETESGKNLGKVEDFLIETETAGVVKFYIKGGLLSPSLILPAEKVVKIIRGKIIFSDDVLEGTKATEAVPT